MTYTSYSPGLQEETARQINSFARNTIYESLQVYEDDRWGVILQAIGGILASIMIFLLAYA